MAQSLFIQTALFETNLQKAGAQNKMSESKGNFAPILESTLQSAKNNTSTSTRQTASRQQPPPVSPETNSEALDETYLRETTSQADQGDDLSLPTSPTSVSTTTDNTFEKTLLNNTAGEVVGEALEDRATVVPAQSEVVIPGALVTLPEGNGLNASDIVQNRIALSNSKQQLAEITGKENITVTEHGASSAKEASATSADTFQYRPEFSNDTLNADNITQQTTAKNGKENITVTEHGASSAKEASATSADTVQYRPEFSSNTHNADNITQQIAAKNGKLNAPIALQNPQQNQTGKIQFDFSSIQTEQQVESQVNQNVGAFPQQTAIEKSSTDATQQTTFQNNRPISSQSGAAGTIEEGEQSKSLFASLFNRNSSTTDEPSIQNQAPKNTARVTAGINSAPATAADTPQKDLSNSIVPKVRASTIDTMNMTEQKASTLSTERNSSDQISLTPQQPVLIKRLTASSTPLWSVSISGNDTAASLTDPTGSKNSDSLVFHSLATTFENEPFRINVTKQQSQQETVRQNFEQQYFDAKLTGQDQGDKQQNPSNSNNESAQQNLLATSSQTSSLPGEPAVTNTFSSLTTGSSEIMTGAANTQPRTVMTPMSSAAYEQEVMEQVLERFQVNRRQYETKLNIRLHPAELGVVKIDLTLKEGTVRANVIAQNQYTQEILDKNSGKLREILEQQGFSVEEIAITSESDSLDSFNLFEEHFSGGHSDNSKESSQSNETESIFSLEDIAQQEQIASIGVNVKV